MYLGVHATQAPERPAVATSSSGAGQGTAGLSKCTHGRMTPRWSAESTTRVHGELT